MNNIIIGARAIITGAYVSYFYGNGNYNRNKTCVFLAKFLQPGSQRVHFVKVSARHEIADLVLTLKDNAPILIKGPLEAYAIQTKTGTHSNIGISASYILPTNQYEYLNEVSLVGKTGKITTIQSVKGSFQDGETIGKISKKKLEIKYRGATESFDFEFLNSPNIFYPKRDKLISIEGSLITASGQNRAIDAMRTFIPKLAIRARFIAPLS